MREFILRFKEEKVSYEEFIRYLDLVYKPRPPVAEEPAGISIPFSVFDNDYLSALETIVKYLRENKEMRFAEIARLLNRDQRAVGVTYRFARRKMESRLRALAVKYSLPASVVADKKLSVLESVVYYIKETYSLPYHKIAVMIRRDDRTVWTVYQRALRKLRKV